MAAGGTGLAAEMGAGAASAIGAGFAVGIGATAVVKVGLVTAAEAGFQQLEAELQSGSGLRQPWGPPATDGLIVIIYRILRPYFCLAS